MNFEKVKGIEPVTQSQVHSLVRCLRSGIQIIDLGEVDFKAGRGVLEGNNRCLWTKKGHRITVAISSDGGMITTQSREIDPDKPRGTHA